MTPRDIPEREPFRLASGGVIDRTRSLNFTFDGKSYAGYPGDTLASALLANGERLVGRSFKYHRPRGIFSAGAEEPNALVEVRTGARREPNTRATMVELYDGLDAASQNRWPSLKFDVQSINGLFSPFFSAGFYYKTFMWPAKFWKLVYEPHHPPKRRAWPRGDGTRSRPLREGLRSLRRARHRLGARGPHGGADRRPRRRARHPRRGGFPVRRASPLGAARPSTASRHGTGCAPSSPS